MLEGKKVCTVEEAAEFLNLGRDSTYQAVRAGQIPALKIGRLYRIPVAALLRMVDDAPRSAA